MTDITLNGIDLSTAVPAAIVRRVTRQLVGDRRDVFEVIPGRPGSWLFAEEPGDRIITIDLELIGEGASAADQYEARRAAVRALASWADTGAAAVQMIIDDEPDRYHLVKLSSAPSPAEWLEDAEVSLEFRASPFAYANALSTTSKTLVDGVAQTFTVPDDVNAYPVIEITAGESLPSGFVLEVNGLQLQYGTAVANGATVTISSLSFTVSLGDNTDLELEGVFVVDDLSMADVDGDFPILVPGSNSIEVTGGDATAIVTWRRQYR